MSKNATVSFEAGAAVKSARFGSGDTAGGSSPQERSRGGDGGAEAGTEQGERASTSEGGSSEGTRAAERTYGEMEGTDEAGGVPWSELCSTGSGMEVQKGLDATREKPSGGKEEEEDRAALVKP